MTYFAYLLLSANDGDQLVGFYWIDPMFAAERIAAKQKYAGKLYLQFEQEEPWTPRFRPCEWWSCL